MANLALAEPICMGKAAQTAGSSAQTLRQSALIHEGQAKRNKAFHKQKAPLPG